MRAQLVICLMVLVCVLGNVDSAFCVTYVDSISYPPKPKETTEQEVVDAWNNVGRESNELGTSMAQGVIDDGGIIGTVKRHKKFYGAIAIFSILLLCWFGGRRN
jgi:hypothetical protein